jgi:hypothetical protein
MPFLGWCQIYRIDPSTHKIAYSEITEVDGTPKDELYDRARKWFDLQYGYDDNVTMSEHKENGELHIHAYLPLKINMRSCRAAYTMVLSVKDGKYRYTITNFFFYHPESKPLAFEHRHLHPRMQIYAKTDEKVQVLIAGIHQKMIRKITASMIDW